MKNLLLIEDSKEIFPLVEQALKTSAMVTWAQSLVDAEELLKKKDFDLVLLDLKLPDGNGIELCSKINTNFRNLPIFILTSNDGLSNIVLGFSAGADDYITKPFNALELKARVEAKLRKQDMNAMEKSQYNWDELKINIKTQDVEVLDQETNQYSKVELTALEFKILTYLAERIGEVIARDTILNDIWGEDIHVYQRSVDTHISKLRKKLGSASKVINSVHGIGYKFNPSKTQE